MKTFLLDAQYHRRALVLIFLSLVISPRVGISQELTVPKRIAVFPFALQNVSEEEHILFRNQVIQIVNSSPNVRVMGDVAMNAIMAEMKFDKLEECTSPACGSYFGKLLGVHAVLTGSIKREGNRFVGTLRLVYVEETRIVLERVFDHDGPLSTIIYGGSPPLSGDLSTITFEQESKYRWYTIGAAIVGGGILVYFVAKGLGLVGGKSEYTEPGQKLPPSDTE